jgi:hypothetical protein
VSGFLDRVGHRGAKVLYLLAVSLKITVQLDSIEGVGLAHSVTLQNPRGEGTHDNVEYHPALTVKNPSDLSSCRRGKMFGMGLSSNHALSGLA